MSRPASAMHRGPVLPYRPLAGVVPCPGGWLLASGKLQGITLSVDEPQVITTLIDVLDYRPSFEILALHAPIGLLDEPRPGGRTCDAEARRLLGPRRGAAVASAPWRSVVEGGVPADSDLAGLSVTVRYLLPRFAEVAKEMQPYRQRTVFEVHPELSYHQLNGDRPLRYPKGTRVGQEERRALLVGRLPGVERLLDARLRRVSPRHLLDAAACLWTCRRIAARAITRIPEDPQWDSIGLRMELVR
jgi:predicted RNase H-like nuclease